EVSLMVGANEDAHHYEPSAQAVASVNEADVFVYSSKDMEFWVNRLLDVVENENLHIVEFSNGLDLKVGEPEHSENLDDHDHGDSDPHFWLNLQKVNKQLDRKSTRLNSSHVSISYAVFCLKKKKKNKNYDTHRYEKRANQ